MYKSKKLKDRVVTIERQPTWSDLVMGLNVGEDFPVFEKDANVVRSEISSTIRFKHPDMQFNTKKQIEDGISYILIRRVR